MAEEELIHRDLTIDELFAKFPHKAQQLATVLSNAGLACVGCQASTHETVEQGVFGHGLDEEELERILRRLNQVLLEENAPADTITITPRGAKKYRAILESEGKEGWSLRFTEKKGGCRGFEYLLDYSERPAEDDEVFESEGIQIHVPKGMVPKLLGSEIDYVDGLQGAGFKISNPNVRTSCGCGSSHGY